MSKKTWILISCLVLSLTLGLGGSLAYLTDTDTRVNTFTMGGVDIKLEEEFQQGSALKPGVNIEKKPTILNEGTNDAWVWMSWAIPTKLDVWNPNGITGANENTIHWNFLGATCEGFISDAYVQKAIGAGHLENGMTAEKIKADKTYWTLFTEPTDAIQKTINGIEYSVYVAKYNKALVPGEETLPIITNVYLDSHVDMDADGNLYRIEDGVKKEIGWNIVTDGTPEIIVNAYAIQAEGFNTVQEAYDAYEGQWGDSALLGNVTEKDAVETNAGYAPATEGGVVDGLHIADKSGEANSLRAIFKNGMTGDFTVKNSYLDGTYAMNVSASAVGLKLTAENTTFRGWTSYAGWESATFTNCTFKVNSEGTQNQLRAHDATTLINCELSGTILSCDNDDGSMGSFTLQDCTYNGELITDVNVIPRDEEYPTGTIVINNTTTP